MNAAARCAAIAGAALASVATAQMELSTAASQTGTIQVTGPRPTDTFFNIEGESQDPFQSYGVLRFDLSAARGEFDTAFGAGAWRVTQVRLELSQDNAAFTTDGMVDVYLATDDAVDIKTALSPLVWPLFDAPGEPDLELANGGAPFLSYTFVEGSSGQIDAYDQAGGPGGAGEALELVADLIADLETDDTLTLVLHDVDPSVAATYGGEAPRSGIAPPTIAITAEAAGGECYADCDESGELDFFDFLCFQNEFAAGEPYADCDESGALDFFDFLCFQNEFAAGCP